MIRAIYVGFVIFLFAAGAQAKVPALILGEANGLPVECEVRGYDVEKGLVKLCAGEKRGVKPFDSFSTNAQQRIVAWATDEAFESSSLLKIRVAQKEVDKREVKFQNSNPSSITGGFDGTTSLIVYSVEFENRSPFEMKGISIDSRIFYEFGTKHNPRQVRVDVPDFDLLPGEAKVLEAGSVWIRDGDRINEQIHSFDGVSEKMEKKIKCKDRLCGAHMLVTKSGSVEGDVSRCVKEGRIPKEEEWDEYT